jgi:hypothetical protein
LLYPEQGVVAANHGLHSDCRALAVKDCGKEAAAWPAVAGNMVNGKLILRKDENSASQLEIAKDLALSAYNPGKDFVLYSGLKNGDREHVKSQGEGFRISPRAHNEQQMLAFIKQSMSSVGVPDLRYYHSQSSGTRFFTKRTLEECLSSPQKQACAEEIARLAATQNVQGQPEVAPFNASFVPKGTVENMLADMQRHEQSPHRADEFSGEGLTLMYSLLSGERLTNTLGLKLCRQYAFWLDWLPGASLKNGVQFHPEASQCTREIILHLCRNHDLKHINVGRVLRSGSAHPMDDDRREVYIVEAGGEKDFAWHVRMLEWDGKHHVGEPSYRADDRGEEYFNFMRRCWSLGMILGMPLPPYQPLVFREEGLARHGFVRPYVQGACTDKLPARWLNDRKKMERVVQLLGSVAASEMIVGRATEQDGVLKPTLNRGDHYICKSEDGPTIITGDWTGCFSDMRSFKDMQQDYLKAMEIVIADPELIQRLYHSFATSLVKKFCQIRVQMEGCGWEDPTKRSIADDRERYCQSQHDGSGTFNDRAGRRLNILRNTPETEFRKLWL